MDRLRPQTISRLSQGPVHDAAILANAGEAVFHVLGHTPEQYEDIYVLLVDDRFVLRFEIERNDSTAKPREVERWSVVEYRRTASGLATKTLAAALGLVGH